MCFKIYPDQMRLDDVMLLYKAFQILEKTAEQ